MNSLKITGNFIWRLLILVLSLMTSFLILYFDRPLGLKFFPIIPFAFGVLYFYCKPLSCRFLDYIGLFSLNICMIIRYLVTPFFMWLDKYNNNYAIQYGIIPDQNYFIKATDLMLLEMIIIFLVIFIFNKRFYNNNTKNFNLLEPSNNIIGIGFIVLSIIIIIMFPGVLRAFNFILSSSYLDIKYIQTPLGGKLIPLVQFANILLTISILNFLYKKKNKNNNNLLLFILSVASILVSSLFIVGSSRINLLFPLLTAFYLLKHLYPEFKRIIYWFAISIIGIVVIITTTIKQKNMGNGNITDFQNGIINNSGILQAYFSGVHNVAVAVKTKEFFYENVNISTFTTDLFSSVAGISQYFYDQLGTNKMFNYAFYHNTIARDQIIPLIGQGYYYLGIIGSSIFCVIVIFLMMYFDKKSKMTKNIFIVYIYAYLAIRFGSYFMSNTIILFSFITNYFLPLLIIVLLNKKITLLGHKK